MKRITKRITSLTLVFAVTAASVCGGVHIKGVMPQSSVAKAATENKEFVRDVSISYASTRDEAQKELGDEYTILENKVGESWVGYTTTDDPDMAIRDIKVQSMSGKYSVSDYEELLKNHKEEIKSQVDIFVPALIEFTKNYDSGLGAAAIICKNLNCFYEDDSDMGLGDYLLEQGRRLISDSNDASAREKLEKIYIEANADLVQEMESIITQGADTKVAKKGTWLSRMSELGPRGLIDQYKKADKTLKSDGAVNNKLEKELGDDAAAILKELPAVQSYIREKEGVDVVKAIEEGDASKVDELSKQVADKEDAPEPTDESTIEQVRESLGQSLDSMPDTLDFNGDVNVGALVLVLKGTQYGDQTMYDFLMNENIKKSDLYTMAYVLSEGQKSIMGDVGLFSILLGAATGYADETEDTDDLFETVGEKVFSIYDGVDRDVFKGDTALTEDAIKRMQTDNDNNALTTSTCVSGFLAGFAACVGVFCTYKMLKSTVSVSKMVTFKLTLPAEESEAFIKANRSVEKLQQELDMMAKNNHALKIRMYQKAGILNNYKFSIINKSAGELEAAYNEAIEQITKAGRKTELMFFSKEAESTFFQERTIKLQQKIALREQAIANGEFVKISKVKETTTRSVSKGARIVYGLGAVVAFAFAGYEIYQLVKKDPKVNYTEIPAKMVSRTYDGDEIQYLAYSVARTKDGKKADLRNWKGKEWVALYTTTDDLAGDPILASTLVSSDKNTVPDADCNPVSEFCNSDVYNVSENGTAYLFFKTGTKGTAVADDTNAGGGATGTEGAVFGGSGMIWIILLIVVVVGVGAGTAIFIRKRKKTE